MARTKRTITNLAAFIARARALGATVEEAGEGQKIPGFAAWCSAPNGGCGSDGCRCSPGLWVTGREGGTHAVAHFGEDWERGGEGYFGDAEIDAWRKLRDESGAS